MAHELEVWLFDYRIGTLALVDGRLNFCYAPGWLSQPGAVALSASLPLQAQPFDDRKTRPFFAGLLPEGQMRRLIAQQFQVSNQNDFALLDHIGGECAGAVTFMEPGQALPVPARNGDVQWLSGQDAHAKNFSLLYSGKTPVLAPFYDTLSTAVYPTLTPKMAMKIGSKYKFNEVQSRHWDQFAEGVGFTKAQAKRRILELAKSLPSTARKLPSAPGLGFAGNAVIERITALVEQRCALTIRRLTDPHAEIDAAAEPFA